MVESDEAMIPRALPLTVHPDARGRLMVLCEEGAPHIYMTTIYPGVIKAWHQHERQLDRMTCIKGMVRIVCSQSVAGNVPSLYEFISGEHSPIRVDIPSGWWHGLQALGSEEAVVVNCPDAAYCEEHPDEIRLPWNDPLIPFDWMRRNG